MRRDTKFYLKNKFFQNLVFFIYLRHSKIYNEFPWFTIKRKIIYRHFLNLISPSPSSKHIECTNLHNKAYTNYVFNVVYKPGMLIVHYKLTRSELLLYILKSLKPSFKKKSKQIKTITKLKKKKLHGSPKKNPSS